MHRRNEHGAVAVEFALLLPLIVIILFATIEFGLGLARLEDYENAAREGARFTALHCASSSCTTAAVWTVVRNSSPDFTSDPAYATPPGTCGSASTDACGFSVCSGPIGGTSTCATATTPLNCTAGDAVTVSWTQGFSFNVPFLSIVRRTRAITGAFRCE